MSDGYCKNKRAESKADAEAYPVAPEILVAVSDPTVLNEEPKSKLTGRDRIRVNYLLDQLMADADGTKELTNGQRKSIEILLNKALANLQATQITGGDDGKGFTINIMKFGDAGSKSPQ